MVDGQFLSRLEGQSFQSPIARWFWSNICPLKQLGGQTDNVTKMPETNSFVRCMLVNFCKPLNTVDYAIALRKISVL